MKIGRTLTLVLAAGSLTHVGTPNAAHAVIFNPVYTDAAGTGFNEQGADGLPTPLALQRRGAFEAAISILSRTLPDKANAKIDIDASWADLGEGVLAGAGPRGWTAGVVGGPDANAEYPWALENYILNQNNNPFLPNPVFPFLPTEVIVPDIRIRFGNAPTWYYGTDGRPPSAPDPADSPVDMMSTAFHEILHGLGFAPSFIAPGDMWGERTTGGGQSIYDSFMRNAAGDQFTGTVDPVNGKMVPDGTTTNNVTWGGINGRLANGQGLERPKLYSPDPYEGGSSLSHTDEATYWGAWETMSPSIPGGEGFDFIDPVVQGMLMDMGYTGVKSLRKFWTSPSGSNSWSASTSWWDPQAPVLGSLPVAEDRVILQQPRMDNPTNSVVTMNVNATVREVVNMNTLNVSGGNLTLTDQGLTNGGKINVSNGKTITTTTLDNIKGAYLPKRSVFVAADPLVPDSVDHFESAPSFVSELTVSGANSKVVASGKVNNNAKITVSNQGRLTVGGRFSNYNDAGTTLGIFDGGRVVLGGVLSNGSAAKITVVRPNSRLIAKGDSTINDGIIEASVGGQIGLKELINIGSMTVKNGSNVAGNQSRVSVDAHTANYGTISIEGESPRPAHTPNFMGDTITNHGTFNLVSNSGVSYSKFNNLGRTNFMGNAPRPDAAARGLADDYEGIAFGGDMTNEGTGILAGPGLMINTGDFINYSMMSTEWDTRSSTLAFIPGVAGEVSNLRTNSADLNAALGGFDGGRIYAERMAMEISLPTLPPVLSAVDDPVAAAARSTTGGIPTLDVFDGAIYLLDTPTNGLSQLLSNISSGLASIFDSTYPGRPVFDMGNPDSIIRLIPGIPGAPIAGFYNNFALGSLEIYAGSSVMLQVPVPGVVALLLAPAGLVLRRRRAGDEA